MAEQRTLRVPDEPGWWWYLEHGRDLKVCRVFYRGGVLVYRDGPHQYAVEVSYGEWAGPIPAPNFNKPCAT